MESFKKKLELSLSLAKAGFKLRNEGSYIGVFWYLLEPLIIFSIFFTIRNIVGIGIENYAAYLLLGLIMFNFFRKTTSESIRAITNNAGLIKSIKLNKEVFIVSAVIKSIFSHFFEIILFIAVLFFSGVQIVNILFYPLIFTFFCMFVLGISFIVCTIGTYLVDFGNIWNIFMRILWFATPIFYSSNLKLPVNINHFNPLYYFITITRGVVVYGQIPISWMVIGMILFSFGFFLLGIFIFEKFKHKFSEMI